jgi:hypothetical protein
LGFLDLDLNSVMISNETVMIMLLYVMLSMLLIMFSVNARD